MGSFLRGVPLPAAFHRAEHYTSNSGIGKASGRRRIPMDGALYYGARYRHNTAQHKESLEIL